MMYVSGSSFSAVIFSTLVLLFGASTGSSEDRPADAAGPPPTTDADVLAEIARYARENGLSGLSPASLAPVGATVTHDERAADPPPTTDADFLAEMARYARENGLSGLSPASLAPVGDRCQRDS